MTLIVFSFWYCSAIKVVKQSSLIQQLKMLIRFHWLKINTISLIKNYYWYMTLMVCVCVAFSIVVQAKSLSEAP